MPLRKRKSGFRDHALCRVLATEQLEGIVVRAEFHVVEGRLDHSLRIAGEVRPEIRIEAAKLHALVPQRGAGWVLPQPMLEGTASPLAIARAPQQHHFHCSGTHGGWRGRDRLLDKLQRRGSIAFARRKAAELKQRASPCRAKARRSLPLLPSTPSLAPGRICATQVVRHFLVVGKPPAGPLEPSRCFIEALQMNGQAAGGLGELVALRKTPQSVLIGCPGHYELAIQLLS